MNNIKKVLSAWMLVACVLPVAAQYPVIPDSVKARGAKQEAEFERKSDAAWEKALPTVLEEAKKGRPYKPWASKPEDLIKSNIPAFPGAEGGGMYTPGGRGGKVIVVTSLEDSGPGTLREACETGGARIIVFNVAGVIRLKSPISVRAPYVTIAGQTAPGDGICVTGQSFLIDTHDVVIRHMRFRRGAQDVAFRDDAVGGNAVGNIMVDHCSASWGLDENMSIYRHVYNRGADGHGLKLPTVNITIQNSIFSEALDTYNHAFGATIGGHNSMFCRNLFASNISRNSSVGMDGDFNFVNNVTDFFQLFFNLREKIRTLYLLRLLCRYFIAIRRIAEHIHQVIVIQSTDKTYFCTLACRFIICQSFRLFQEVVAQCDVKCQTVIESCHDFIGRTPTAIGNSSDTGIAP